MSKLTLRHESATNELKVAIKGLIGTAKKDITPEMRRYFCGNAEAAYMFARYVDGASNPETYTATLGTMWEVRYRRSFRADNAGNVIKIKRRMDEGIPIDEAEQAELDKVAAHMVILEARMNQANVEDIAIDRGDESGDWQRE